MKISKNDAAYLIQSLKNICLKQLDYVNQFFSNVNIMTSKYRTNISIECLCCAQACPTLCSPFDCGLSGSSVHGILRARILEQVAISHFRGPSQPRNQNCCLLCLLHWKVDSLPLYHLGSPSYQYTPF